MRDLPESCVETDTFLREKGFQSREVPTADPHSRWRYYYRDFRSWESNVMLRVELKFDLAIHDDPAASYDENNELHYESISLVVFNRQMFAEPGTDGYDYYDEDSEDLRKINQYPLSINSFESLEAWMAALSQ